MTGPRVTDGKVMLRDDERKVMRAMRPRPVSCIHYLHGVTGIPYASLIKVVNGMVRAGDLLPVPDPVLGNKDHQYVLRSPVSYSRKAVRDDELGLLSPAGSLTEGQMRDRIVMLKNMKDRLITSWHPVLDILIKDYQREVDRVESFREPPEPDEIDVLDRDFDETGE